MTAANRLRLTMVRETTAGTTPTTPRMRTERLSGEALELYVPEYVEPDEVRSDRMDIDATQVFKNSRGSYHGKVIYPDDLSPRSEIYMSAFESTWTNTPKRDNDGTADSVITAIATTNTIATVTTGASFVAGHLVKFTNFGVSGNNGIFKCTTGSATVPRFVGSGITDEAVPPATARMEVCGFQGASADITATAVGLASTLLDFTTLGISVGSTLKIGGTATGDKFATAALNVWVTVVSVAANLITLANRPAGWTTDDGSGKTIKVWFGDFIKNGTTQNVVSMEKGFMGQATPNYHVAVGMGVNKLTHMFGHKKEIEFTAEFMGMGGSKSTTSLDDTPDAATTGRVFASNVNTGRLAEGGSLVASPDFCREFAFTINNNLREVEDITIDYPAGHNDGNCQVDIDFKPYYGSATFIDKFYSGAATSAHMVQKKDSQALAWLFPRFVYREGGNPAASGKNTDVDLPLKGRASYDSTYVAHIIMCRLPYYE